MRSHSSEEDWCRGSDGTENGTESIVLEMSVQLPVEVKCRTGSGSGVEGTLLHLMMHPIFDSCSLFLNQHYNNNYD